MQQNLESCCKSLCDNALGAISRASDHVSFALAFQIGRMWPMPLKTQIDANAFEADAEAVICLVKGSLSEVIAGIPTLSFKRATDLAVGLGIDSKLAWKISRFVDGTDPFAAARFIPGPSAMKIFLRAAARRHAPPGVISAAEKAFASFRQLVRAHAGNRKYFDMMVAAHATADRGSSDLEHRRLTFEGNSFVWGVQAARSSAPSWPARPRMGSHGTRLPFAVLLIFVRCDQGSPGGYRARIQSISRTAFTRNWCADRSIRAWRRMDLSR